ncbi:GNAT family N-acetyltransferase [Burkholderia ubonensis]|uniref:GNAT family N-acetyltransferase n=1 Tax=Burkholderia ubonensis TaxID=101571 RepID=UPI0038CD2EEB
MVTGLGSFANQRCGSFFAPLASDDLPELRTWFEDSKLSRQLSFPTDEWFVYVTAGAAARCWVALDAGRIIGLMQVDREDSERGHLDLAVRPDLRGQGIGTAVLAAVLSGPGRAYAILEGRIEPDNVASSLAADAVGSRFCRSWMQMA